MIIGQNISEKENAHRGILTLVDNLNIHLEAWEKTTLSNIKAENLSEFATNPKTYFTENHKKTDNPLFLGTYSCEILLFIEILKNLMSACVQVLETRHTWVKYFEKFYFLSVFEGDFSHTKTFCEFFLFYWCF